MKPQILSQLLIELQEVSKSCLFFYWDAVLGVFGIWGGVFVAWDAFGSIWEWCIWYIHTKSTRICIYILYSTSFFCLFGSVGMCFWSKSRSYFCSLASKAFNKSISWPWRSSKSKLECTSRSFCCLRIFSCANCFCVAYNTISKTIDEIKF